MKNEIIRKLVDLATSPDVVKLDDAISILEAASNIDDASAEVFRMLGDFYQKKNELELALKNYLRCSELTPADANLHYTMGNIEISRTNYENAVGHYESALALVEFPEAYVNLSTAYLKLGDLERYHKLLHDTIIKFPDYWIGYYNLGVYYYGMEKLPEAINYYTRCMEINPTNKLVKFSLSLALLKNKDYMEGFKLYENRWGVIPMCPIREITKDLWLGQNVDSSSSIIVTTEQGYGDFIQMSRYLSLLEDIFSQVYVEVQFPMLRLAQVSFPNIIFIEYGNQLPEADYYIPLMSLPHAFRTDFTSIPNDIPYIQCLNNVPHAYRGSRLKVGLCWKGSQDNPDMIHRSLVLEDFSNFISHQNIQWVSLVKEPSVSEREFMRLNHVKEISDSIVDFYDTTEIISELDAVVSVDTSVAHLSSAMGKPTYILLNSGSDWRWHIKDTYSPWYPTAKIIRTEDLNLFSDLFYNSLIEFIAGN